MTDTKVFEARLWVDAAVDDSSGGGATAPSPIANDDRFAGATENAAALDSPAMDGDASEPAWGAGAGTWTEQPRRLAPNFVVNGIL
jgi:hypothetical protein